MYLVHLENVSQTNEKIILGLAESSIEAFSLIYNFFKMCADGCPRNTFEGSVIHFNILIYEMSSTVDTIYLNRLIHKYELEDQEKPDYIEDNLYGNWLFLIYESSEGTVVISASEANNIKSIISRAKLVL